MASLTDFSLVKSHLASAQKAFGISALSSAFYYLAVPKAVGVSLEEVDECITDTHYILAKGDGGGHDRGVDAVYIEERDERPRVHLFNCKYTDKFDKTNAHFPSGEIDKLIGFITALLEKDESLDQHVNAILYSKVEEIWELFEKDSPEFVVHLCANLYQGLEAKEEQRIRDALDKFSFKFKYHLMPDLVSYLTKKDIKVVDAKIKVIDKNYFEKSDGNVRALVANVDARDLLRIVIDNDELRSTPSPESYDALSDSRLLPDAFEENVRVYLKQKTTVNKNIKKTALSDENRNFFYFNNGITIICNKFSYPPTMKGPIVSLEGLQIVNGGQNINSLFEAFKEDAEAVGNIEVLCRVYEASNKELGTRIAEYTNSQNPVRSRDIRSIDYIQEKVEAELRELGYYYERKKNRFQDKPRDRVIDAEKVGQAKLAFSLMMPREAKARKSLVFGSRYDEIFNEETTASEILLVHKLLDRIEERRKAIRAAAVKGEEIGKQKSFVLHATYYLLYVLSRLAGQKGVEKELKHEEEIWSLYADAESIVGTAVTQEINKAGSKYSHATFFKKNAAKNRIDKLLTDLE